MKRHILFICVGGLLSLRCGMLYGQDVDEVLSRLQRKYESLRDLSASFTQVVRFGVMQSTQTFGGKLWMKKNNKYRIEMDQQTIVTDGQTVWTYSELNRQVFIDTFRDDPKSITPERLLATAPKNYFASLIGKEQLDGVETIVLKLVPKDSKSSMKSMKLWIDPSSWLMTKVEVLDASETLTTYGAKDVKINAGIDDGLFRFTPPPGVDVIDLRTSQ